MAVVEHLVAVDAHDGQESRLVRREVVSEVGPDIPVQAEIVDQRFFGGQVEIARAKGRRCAARILRLKAGSESQKGADCESVTHDSTWADLL